jgi:quercetin dioxygenase-like cupin family protein
MVQIFRVSSAEDTTRAGYSAKYVADISFKENLKTGGFILVTIPAGTSTSPHSHGKLEEVFIAWTPLILHIDDELFQLNAGDIALVEPHEKHSFTASSNCESKVLAIKFPNIKDDKIN